MGKRTTKLPVQYKCSRTKISGHNERTLVQQAIRGHEESNSAPKFHAVYRKGPFYKNHLWVVSSKKEGVPFAEAVIDSVSERPLLAVSREIQKNGEFLWLVRIDKAQDGSDVIEEISVQLDPNNVYREALGSFIQKALKQDGRVVFVNDVFSGEGDNGISHVAFGGELEQPWFINEDTELLEKAKEKAGRCWEVERVQINFDKAKITTQETKRLPIPKSKMQVMTLLAVIIGFVWAFMAVLSQKEIEHQIQVTEIKKQEWVERFSSGVAPKYALYQIYRMLVGEADSRFKFGLLDSVSGWEVKSVELKPENIIIRMKGENTSSIDIVRKAASQLEAGSLAISQFEVAIVKEFDSACRMPILSEPVKMPIEGISNYLINAFRMYAPDTKIEFGSEEKKDGYSIRSMTLSVNQVSPETLDIMGSLLNFLPIDFKTASFSTSGERNLLDGQMSLEILGCTISEIDENGLCKS